MQEAVKKTELSWSIDVRAGTESGAGLAGPRNGTWSSRRAPREVPPCRGGCQLAVRGRGSGSSSAAHLLCDLGQVTCPLSVADSCSARCWTVSPETLAGRSLEASHSSPGYFYQDCGQAHHSESERGRMQGSPKVTQQPLLCLRLGWLAPPAEPEAGAQPDPALSSNGSTLHSKYHNLFSPPLHAGKHFIFIVNCLENHREVTGLEVGRQGGRETGREWQRHSETETRGEEAETKAGMHRGMGSQTQGDRGGNLEKCSKRRKRDTGKKLREERARWRRHRQTEGSDPTTPPRPHTCAHTKPGVRGQIQVYLLWASVFSSVNQI